jgi:hypothetical protein
MLDRLCCVLLLTLLPGFAQANVGTARAGEHETFTRVTVSTNVLVSGLDVTETGPNRFQMTIRPEISELDTSRLFDRLSAGRIQGLSLEDGVLELTLDCACSVKARTEGARLLVMDVFPKTQSTVTLPLLPQTPGVLSGSMPLPTKPVDTFDLDHAVVDHVTQSIAAQISQNAHITGFADFTPELLANTAPQASTTPRTARQKKKSSGGVCQWSDDVWDAVTAAGHPTEKGAQEIFDAGPAMIEANIRKEVLGFLTRGLVVEARMAFATLHAAPDATERFNLFLNLLDGSIAETPDAVDQCNPLHDLLLAAARAGKDLPKDRKIAFLRTFQTLPAGLQIYLYPNMIWLIEDAGQDMFPKLQENRRAELALMQRQPLTDDTSEETTDPDDLAALSLELRGTEFERQSWEAAFSSYLESNRFFDAIEHLDPDAPLPMEVRQRAVSRFVDYLVDHADSVTFVQLSLERLDALDPTPSFKDLERVSERLRDEGFHEEANALFGGPSVVKTQPIAEAAKKEGVREVRVSDVSNERTMPKTPRPEPPFTNPGSVTVANARKQLEQAQKVRSSLLKRYAE